jgi:hypothetical protein
VKKARPCPKYLRFATSVRPVVRPIVRQRTCDSCFYRSTRQYLSLRACVVGSAFQWPAAFFDVISATMRTLATPAHWEAEKIQIF